MHLVIYEGPDWHDLSPLTLMRPTFLMPSGAGTLLSKQIDACRPKRLSLWVRPELGDLARRAASALGFDAAINQPLDEDPALLLDGRTLPLSSYEYPNQSAVVVDDDEPLVREAFVDSAPGLRRDDILHATAAWRRLGDLPHSMPQSRLVRHVWDLIAWNEEALIADSIRWKGCSSPPPDGPFHVVEPYNVCVAGGVVLKPGCVLDGSRGPVMIGEGATLGAGCVIEGPCAVGAHCTIEPNSLLRSGTSIGPRCIVGGQIVNSLLAGFCEAPRIGFIGDSLVGAWVHLGAGSTTANLKVTYGQVRMSVARDRVPTGRWRIGAVIGDHSKIAVGTRLTAGSYVGCAALLAGEQLTPPFVPSFTFWRGRSSEIYAVGKASEVARRMAERFGRAWGEEDDAVLRYAQRAAGQVERG